MPVNIFEPTDNGYAGRIRLFAIDEAIMLVAAEPSDAEDAADYRIHLDDADGPIVGFARKRTSERAGDYIALEIESPGSSPSCSARTPTRGHSGCPGATRDPAGTGADRCLT